MMSVVYAECRNTKCGMLSVVCAFNSSLPYEEATSTWIDLVCNITMKQAANIHISYRTYKIACAAKAGRSVCHPCGSIDVFHFNSFFPKCN